MSGAEISITTYDKLVRESERLTIITEFVRNNTVITDNEMRILLGIKKKESDDIGKE